jgi:hypothetical protein
LTELIRHLACTFNEVALSIRAKDFTVDGIEQLSSVGDEFANPVDDYGLEISRRDTPRITEKLSACVSALGFAPRLVVSPPERLTVSFPGGDPIRHPVLSI